MLPQAQYKKFQNNRPISWAGAFPAANIEYIHIKSVQAQENRRMQINANSAENINNTPKERISFCSCKDKMKFVAHVRGFRNTLKSFRVNPRAHSDAVSFQHSEQITRVTHLIYTQVFVFINHQLHRSCSAARCITKYVLQVGHGSALLRVARKHVSKNAFFPYIVAYLINL